MNAVYVIVENGDPYPVAYASFESAAAVVKETHKRAVEEERMEVNNTLISHETTIPENTKMGKTYIYVEKEIHIYIYKLPVLSF